jgi:plasmid stabilization system protein ParE
MRERPSAPGLFSDEFTRAVERLKSMPGSGAVFDSMSVRGARRILLPRCGYHVYYTLDSKKREVLVRAVWHSARGSGPELGEV